jgi:hypothetical protein
MRTLGAIVLVVAALVAGCGGDEEKDPFGAVSRADEIRATDVFNHVGRFSFENQDWLAAIDKGNLKRAHREFNGGREAVADARAVVDEIENQTLQTRVGDYVATLEAYVAAAGRLMTAAERKRRVDRETEDRLISEFDDAVKRVDREEQELREFLLDHLSEEQRKEFERRSE